MILRSVVVACAALIFAGNELCCDAPVLLFIADVEGAAPDDSRCSATRVSDD